MIYSIINSTIIHNYIKQTFNSTPLCVSGLGRAFAHFHASPSTLCFQRADNGRIKVYLFWRGLPRF